jgi:hypothetical protein
VTDAGLNRFGRLAHSALWIGATLLLISIIGWQVWKVMIGGTGLLNVAAVLIGVGLFGDLTARTIKMKRKARQT